MELLKEYEKIWAIEYAEALLGWDAEVNMPEGAAEERGEAEASLSSLKRELVLSLGRHLDKFNPRDDREKGILRVLRRMIKYFSIPEEVLRRFRKVTSRAPVVWRRARARADFGIFEKDLREIIEILREMAEHLGYEDHPYDALVDLYEEGMRIKELDSIFNSLLPPLRGMLKRIMGRWPSTHPLERQKYSKESLEALIRELLDLLGFDRKHMRIDTSPHPFSTSIGLHDVRITVRYQDKNFKEPIMAAIHEFGHALYDFQCDASLRKTPVCRGASLGLHESQSRFWENMVGRSLPFASLLAELLRKYLFAVEPQELYIYFNTVRPSPIRIEADEVTYNFHIAVRYELEKELLEGSLDVRELPQAWNERMEKYLGITPSNDALGVLQDIHWSLGAVGYFPTYTIGNLLAAQLYYALPLDMEEVVEGREFDRLREWLKEKIHKWGAIYPPRKIIIMATGEELNPKYFIRYIKEKYLSRNH